MPCCLGSARLRVVGSTNQTEQPPSLYITRAPRSSAALPFFIPGLVVANLSAGLPSAADDRRDHQLAVRNPERACAGGSSERLILIPGPVQKRTASSMDRRPPARRRPGDPHRRGAAMHGAVEQQKQHRGRRPQGTVPPPPAGYFTAELLLAFVFVAVSLAFLPLVLPPLSPPPFLLLLVPVGLLAVLLALAFVPLDAHSHLVVVGSGSSR
jgi:hypothetical protein